MLTKPDSSTMCPPGYHVVRGHERVCHSGTRTWVDAHIAKNPTRNVKMLLQENLLFLFWSADKKYPTLGTIKGFPAHQELDSVIQFWMDYWSEQGLNSPKIDPLLIKTQIAVESGFNPKADPKVKGSSAYGLMQITGQARRVLAGTPNSDGYREMKSPYLQVSRSDLEDPIVSIAAGTRWLIHKYAMIPKEAEKTPFNMLKNYFSWNTGGDIYAKKVEDLYKKSK